VLIEIKGVQFVNKGAELMLHAIIQKAKEIWPDAEFCIKPNKNSPYKKRAQVEAFQKLDIRKNIIDFNGLFYFLPKKLRDGLKGKWGIVTEADIDVVLDASGFSYGDQWSTVILKQAAIEAKRLNKKGKHYIFMPQALGPFTSGDNQIAAKQAFESASVIFAREEESFEFAKACAKSANIIQSPDFTNLVKPTHNREYAHLKGCVAVIPNSKMLSEKNQNSLWRNNYVEMLQNIIELIQTNGEKVFLLNHEGKADRAICNQINEALIDKLEVIEPENALEVKGVIGRSKFVVCSRYHGCISALSQCVPCIGTSWSHKYEQLFKEYGVSNYLLSPEYNKQQLSKILRGLFENTEQESKNLKSPSKSFKSQSKELWLTLEKQFKK